MNLVLFEPGEWRQGLAATDPRAVHLKTILRLKTGDRFLAGEVGGALGSLVFRDEGERVVFEDDRWDALPPPVGRVHLVVGTPRPPTARRLLKDMTTLGVAALHFVATDLGDKSYLQSTLWKGEYVDALKEGASQTKTTVLPSVARHTRLSEVLTLPQGAPSAFLDLGGVPFDELPEHRRAHEASALWLAVGPERGWTDAERSRLREAGWTGVSLGPRILRTETACAVAVGVAHLKGWLTRLEPAVFAP